MVFNRRFVPWSEPSCASHLGLCGSGALAVCWELTPCHVTVLMSCARLQQVMPCARLQHTTNGQPTLGPAWHHCQPSQLQAQAVVKWILVAGGSLP